RRVTLWPATVRCVDSPVGSIWASTHAGVALAVCEMPKKSSSPVTYPTFQTGMSFGAGIPPCVVRTPRVWHINSGWTKRGNLGGLLLGNGDVNARIVVIICLRV